MHRTIFLTNNFKKHSYEECREAINIMKKEISPGLDGLPSEIYQCVWDVIGPFF